VIASKHHWSVAVAPIRDRPGMVLVKARRGSLVMVLMRSADVDLDLIDFDAEWDRGRS
jgi:hypothetical protein